MRNSVRQSLNKLTSHNASQQNLSEFFVEFWTNHRSNQIWKTCVDCKHSAVIQKSRQNKFFVCFRFVEFLKKKITNFYAIQIWQWLRKWDYITHSSILYCCEFRLHNASIFILFWTTLLNLLSCFLSKVWLCCDIMTSEACGIFFRFLIVCLSVKVYCVCWQIKQINPV